MQVVVPPWRQASSSTDTEDDFRGMAAAASQASDASRRACQHMGDVLDELIYYKKESEQAAKLVPKPPSCAPPKELLAMIMKLPQVKEEEAEVYDVVTDVDGGEDILIPCDDPYLLADGEDDDVDDDVIAESLRKRPRI